MKKIVTILILTITLLFGYQKGNVVGDDISKKLGLSKDKIYVIDFFASWCGSCKKDIPYISLVNSSLDKSRFEIIGVDIDEDIQKGESFVKLLRDEKKLNYKVVEDPKNEIVKDFNPVAMPALFFIKDLKVQSLLIGAKDDIDKRIKEILEELK